MISITGLGKRFGDQWVFRGLDLEVTPGESIALIGPSGHGKSVLLKTVSGLLLPEEGSVQLGSQDIGMLFQKNALFDSFTVEENLTFPLRERKGISGEPARKRASEMLAAVGLAGNEQLYPDELSGGMQKRLGIARALIVEPKILLYDEPTAGLDPITSRTIADLVRDLRSKTRSTLLVVTNDMQRAYQLGDRIALLAKGALVMGGSPKEIQSSKDPRILQFIYGRKEGPLTRRPGGESDALA
jgi:phospholipid/cholesterol/gamma-HCH transport system ATP-binding protein